MRGCATSHLSSSRLRYTISVLALIIGQHPAAFAQETTTQIAITDEPAPNSEGAFEDFFLPIINDDDEIAFIALTATSPVPIYEVFVRAADGTLESRLIRNLDGYLNIPQAALDRSNVTTDVYRSEYFAIGDAGSVVALTQEAVGSFGQSGSIREADLTSTTTIAREGLPAMGAGADDVFIKLDDIPPSAIRVNNAGDSAFFSLFADSSNQSLVTGGGIFRSQGGELSLAYRTGDTIASGEQISSFLDREFALNNTGELAFAARMSGAGISTANDSYILRENSVGSLVTVAREGDAAPGFGDPNIVLTDQILTQTAQEISFNSSGMVAFGADVFDNGGANTLLNSARRDAIFLGTSTDDLQLLIKRGDLAGNLFDLSTVNFSNPDITDLSAPLLADSGEVVFIATAGSTVAGNGFDHAVLRYDLVDDTFDNIAQTDQFLPGGTFVYTQFNDVAVNDLGDVAFTTFFSSLDAGGGLALLAEDENRDLRLVVKTGDTMQIDQGDSRVVSEITFVGGSSAAGLSIGYNAANSVVFAVDFDGGTSKGLFINSSEFQAINQFVWSGACGSGIWHDLTCGDSNWINGATGDPAGLAPGSGANETVSIANAAVTVQQEVDIFSIVSTGLLRVEDAFAVQRSSSIENLTLNVDPAPFGPGFGPNGLNIGELLALKGQDNVWLNGSIFGTGVLDIEGGLDASPAEGSTLNLAMRILDGGSVTVDGTDLQLEGDGEIEVLDGGTLKAGSGGISGGLTVNGTLEKTSSAEFNLSDLVVEGGTLNLREGTLRVDLNSTAQLSGNINVAPGARMVIDGLQFFNTTIGDLQDFLSINGLDGGGGQVIFQDTKLNPFGTATLLVGLGGQDGGVHFGSGSTIAPGGDVLVADGGKIIFETASDPFFLGSRLEIDGGGLAVQEQRDVTLGADGLDILSLGTYEIQGGTLTGSGIDTLIRNAGTIAKTGSGLATIEGRISQTDSSLIEVREGTLAFGASPDLSQEIRTLAGATTRFDANLEVGIGGASGRGLILSGEGQAINSEAIFWQPGALITLRDNGDTGGLLLTGDSAFIDDPSLPLVVDPFGSLLLVVDRFGRLVVDTASPQEDPFRFTPSVNLMNNLGGTYVQKSGFVRVEGNATNAGRMNIEGGTLIFDPAVMTPDTTGPRTVLFNGADFDIADGARVVLASGGATISQRVRLTGAGSFALDEGTTLIFGDAFANFDQGELVNELGTPLVIAGATLSGARLNALSQRLTNHGTLILRSGTISDLTIVNSRSSSAGEGDPASRIVVSADLADPNASLQLRDVTILNVNGEMEVLTDLGGFLPALDGNPSLTIQNLDRFRISDADIGTPGFFDAFSFFSEVDFDNEEGGVISISGESNIYSDFRNDGKVIIEEGADVTIGPVVGLLDLQPVTTSTSAALLRGGEWEVRNASLELRASLPADTLLPLNGIVAGAQVTLVGPDAAINPDQPTAGIGRTFIVDGTARLTLVDNYFRWESSGRALTFGLDTSGPVFKALRDVSFQNTSHVTCIGDAGINLPFGTIFVNGVAGKLDGECTISASVINIAEIGDPGRFARIRPGQSPGIMRIGEDFTNATGGVLEIEIGGTQAGIEYDQLIVGGTTTLEEGSQIEITLLDPNPDDGVSEIFRPGPNDEFQIIVSDEFVLADGQDLEDFIVLTNNPGGVVFRPSLIESDGLTLLALLAQLGIRDDLLASFDPQIAATALYVNSLLLDPELDNDALRDALSDIVALDDAVVGLALSELHPEAYASAPFALARNSAVALTRSLDNQAKSRLLDGPSNTTNLWIDFLGATATRKAMSGTGRSGFNTGLFGLVGGVDVQLSGESYFGLLAGYTDANQTFEGLAARTEVDSTIFGVYGGARSGALSVSALVARLDGDANTSRSLNQTLNGSIARSNYSIDSWVVHGEARYAVELGKLELVPHAALTVIDAKRGAAQESGGSPLGLAIDTARADSVRLELGGDLSGEWKLGEALVRPYLSVGWRHDFEDHAHIASARIVGAGDARLNVLGAVAGENGLALGAGVTTSLAKGINLFAQYNGEFASRETRHSGRVGVMFQFYETCARVGVDTGFDC